MPIARIYASQVEEAEPICADLLARGYNVEVVFPDAVLSNPADLELRVERCSAEEAVARVEASGSSSRCVFMTPSKGPRRELLLVEMTVLATGTDGRHPMMPLTTMNLTPVPLPVVPQGPLPVSEMEQFAGLIASTPVPTAETTPSLAEVLPFPAVSPEGAEMMGKAIQAWPVTEGDGSLSKHLIFELNAFLAHAPAVEHADGLYVKWFENVRQSVNVQRARKNWEGLTLAGVAASLVLLTLLGWYAGPGPSRGNEKASVNSHIRASESGTASRLSAMTSPQDSLQSVALKVPASNAPGNFATGQARVIRRGRQPESAMQDEVIAQDQVTRIVRRTVSKGWTTHSSQISTTSELVQPAAIRSAARSAPIKVITDLK